MKLKIHCLYLAFLFCPLWCSAQPIHTITIDADQAKAPTEFMQGFLHGYADWDDITTPLLGNNLKPRFWRLGHWGDYDQLRAATNMNPKVTMVLSDLLAHESGGYSGAQPPPPADVTGWNTWKTNWDLFCRKQANISLGLAARPLGTANVRPVEYWEVWNETDLSVFWTGTWHQALEAHQIAYDAIKAVIPTALVIGPAIANFRATFDSDPSKDFFDFITELEAPPYSTRLDGIAWHDAGYHPSGIPDRADEVRTFLQSFSPPYLAELHINEYAGPAHTGVPGWLLAYIYYAEEADLNFMSLACWRTYQEGLVPLKGNRTVWNCCAQGLNGRFMTNMKTVQQSYLVHWGYSKIHDHPRIVAASSHANVTAIASRDNGSSRILSMTGICEMTTRTNYVTARYTNWPYASPVADVTVWYYRNNNVMSDDGTMTEAKPADAQPTNINSLVVFSGRLPVVNGTVTYNLWPHLNNDVYQVELKAPGPGPITSMHYEDKELSGLPPAQNALPDRLFSTGAVDTSTDGKYCHLLPGNSVYTVAGVDPGPGYRIRVRAHGTNGRVRITINGTILPVTVPAGTTNILTPAYQIFETGPITVANRSDIIRAELIPMALNGVPVEMDIDWVEVIQ